MKFHVPYNYLPQQFGDRPDIFLKWGELAKSGEFTLGPYVQNFEEKFAEYMGTKFCISTNTGTDALILSLKAVGVKNGDEVITVPNTFYATVGAIVACGAVPVFVDVDERMQIDSTKLEKKIGKKTKALIPVYWGGAGPEMDSVINMARAHNLKIVSDACMAIGGYYSGRTAANWGDVVAYSMHPLKSLNVMGDGGAISTNNPEYAKWLVKYRNHGMINRDEIDFYGVNSRMQPLQAVVADLELENLDKVVARRNEIASKYDRDLSPLAPRVLVPPRLSNDIETFCLYMLQVDNRNELISFLNTVGVEAKVHYPVPLHLQKASQVIGIDCQNLENSESQAKKIITIPCHQFLKEEQVDFVIKSIQDFYS